MANSTLNKDAVTTLTPVNANVHSVHLPDASHVDNLKRIGSFWKFKAIGYDGAGHVVPGSGPLTDRHNTPFSEPDAMQVSVGLGFPAWRPWAGFG